MAETVSPALTSGRLLARNTLFNLIGQAAPMLVAIFAIPMLIKGLGTERFGVLTLAWMAVGYFSLFDLGLGRALTKLVAEKLGAGQEREIPSLVWTSLFLMTIMGLLGMLVVIIISPWLVNGVLKIPIRLKSETLKSFYLLAISIPLVIGTAGLGGVLAAYQRFGLINAIRIPMGIYTFLGPLLVLPFSHSLFPVVAVLVAGRLIGLIVHLLLCFYVTPALRNGIVLQRLVIRPLISFGSWMTVTNIVGPLMVYLDRFLIGALVSMASVAYYATPYEVVTKLWLIPGALVGVLFPAFSASFVQDPNRTTLLFNRGVKFVFLALFPLTLLLVTFAHEGLYLWLGIEFAQNSYRVLQWLAVGVFINSLAQIPFALVQGAGRPDITSKLHLAELPIYLVSVWLLIHAYGIEGAAIAWMARVTVDALLLFVVAKRILFDGKFINRCTVLLIGVTPPIFTIGFLMYGIILKGIFLLLTFGIFTLATWFLILAPEEKEFVQKRFNLSEFFSK